MSVAPEATTAGPRTPAASGGVQRHLALARVSGGALGGTMRSVTFEAATAAAAAGEGAVMRGLPPGSSRASSGPASSSLATSNSSARPAPSFVYNQPTHRLLQSLTMLFLHATSSDVLMARMREATVRREARRLSEALMQPARTTVHTSLPESTARHLVELVGEEFNRDAPGTLTPLLRALLPGALHFFRIHLSRCREVSTWPNESLLHQVILTWITLLTPWTSRPRCVDADDASKPGRTQQQPSRAAIHVDLDRCKLLGARVPRSDKSRPDHTEPLTSQELLDGRDQKWAATRAAHFSAFREVRLRVVATPAASDAARAERDWTFVKADRLKHPPTDYSIAGADNYSHWEPYVAQCFTIYTHPLHRCVVRKSMWCTRAGLTRRSVLQLLEAHSAAPTSRRLYECSHRIATSHPRCLRRSGAYDHMQFPFASILLNS